MRILFLLFLLWFGLPSEGLAVPVQTHGAEQSQWMAKGKKRKKRRKRRRKKRPRKKKKKKKVKAKAAETPPAPSPAPKPALPPPAPAKPGPSEAAVAAQGDEEGPPGIAVMDITAVHGVPQGIATLLNELVLTRLKASNRFGSVLGGSDMAAMLDMEQQKQAMGCEADSCLAELGGALGVPLMLTAQLGKMGDQVMVTLKVIAIEDSKVVVRAIEMAPDEGALPSVFDRILGKALVELFPDSAPKPPSVVEADQETGEDELVDDDQDGPGPGPMVYAGMGLAALGGGLAGYTAWQWGETQATFDSQNDYTSDDLDDLASKAESANMQVVGGVIVGGLGLLLTWVGW